MHDTDTALETHELTYPGRVDPAPGIILGPGDRLALWRVIGTVHHPAGHSVVTVERARDIERAGLQHQLARRQASRLNASA